ncbi:bacterial regulatory helix-turn-helix, lysR family protein [Burkholderia ambifaria AMMD]|uniref:Transcriptional regulator, LysR family n=1 Tax=Burkholderia ambifaria (strain ATCC BAA-244 / DSM 16087 / CCUG 44356 / LMG 19182 / AMMD) TaxID=339670 RepID=Q0B2G8_BURCM|nr:LysR family transcriptional regulator [Burkholderia ambifaria]ABI91655.1 transcriptional regulator, LysR family [Burkholderia ambifaria AMMD]AJY26672.1 bacterial regulatory helix-turn-helix, lysR family protein [Burkholderia ambifaria AMMD]MBR7933396.1 LysR family transcriptional regulator [Burkholderia ambifaria]PEH70460.1 LysR family transcriptional regulator [Burkholderia ambifaria]QQC08358.1 LysR family transcriptional regulator [Burkholderia ambifaria]
MRSSSEKLSGSISVFAAVVDMGTFAAASEVIGMTPPGVSRAIARLEKKLNIRLFNRTTRSVSLTEEGRRFYEQVMPHLAGLEEAAAAAAGSASAVRGKLRVNLDPVVYRTILGPQLDAFMDAHPELEIELIARDSLGDLVMDGFDIAVRFGEPRASTLIARKLLDTGIVTVASPAYIARWGRPAKPEDLESRSHRCIEFRNPETGKPFAWEFHRRRKRIVVDTRGRLTVNDPGALLNACLAGSGIAQMLLLGAEPLIANGQLINLFPEWADERFPLYAYYPSRHHLPAKTRAFLDFVVELMSKNERVGTR